MKTAEEVLKDKYRDHFLDLDYIELTIDAMEEYAKAYHESRMKEELIDFQKWYYDKYYGLEIEDSEERIIDDYLATRKNK